MGHTSVRTACGAGLVCLLTLAACSEDGVTGDDDVIDSGPTIDGAPLPDVEVPDEPCNLAGTWIGEQHVVSTALSTPQKTTTWYWYEITQTGDEFTITDSLNCGLIVDGTATVTLPNATLTALSTMESAGVGRKGTFKANAADNGCDFVLQRNYNLRGGNKAKYLTDTWNVGDAPKPLSEFVALSKTDMEDWDGDTKPGITLKAGSLGDRYVVQRDWNEHAGTAPQFATRFGHDPATAEADSPSKGTLVVTWDSQEAVSDETPNVLLRISADPDGNGWARYARSNIPKTTPLETCLAVQAAAGTAWN